jgi:hypothetical protein
LLERDDELELDSEFDEMSELNEVLLLLLLVVNEWCVVVDVAVTDEYALLLQPVRLADGEAAVEHDE